MSVDPAIRRELCDLLGQLRDGQLDPRGLARLDAIVTADPSARRLYLAYAELCASLHWAQNSRHGECGMVHGEPSATIALGSAAAAIHHSSFTMHHWSVLSYVMATLLLGAMIVGGWVWRGPAGRTPPAQALRRPPAAAQHLPELVGQITRTVDCRWADQKNVAKLGESVALGRVFDLKSGVLEITYGVGARVVVHGEATYAVDSCNSGILASLDSGNVTVIVDGRPVAGGHGSAKAKAAPSEGRPGPSGNQLRRVEDPSRVFALRIPWHVDHDRYGLASIVCGRGTEFKMRRDRPGKTSALAVRGRLKLEMPDGKPLLYMARSPGEGDKLGGFDASGELRLVLTPPARPALAKNQPPPPGTVYAERKKIGTPEEKEKKIED